MSALEGRSGMELRTSVSMRWRNSLNERQAAADLAGHLGQLVRPEQDDGHHGDDQKLGGVEIEHLRLNSTAP